VTIASASRDAAARSQGAPQTTVTSFWRAAQLDTIRLALIKVVGRVAELASRIELALPSDHLYRGSLTLLAARVARPP
jgi:hypothetical protein